ncbi:MAG: glutathione-dependent formaldehyde-activating [Devosia sp.]|uniref:GFA family protein n=1 Tax=Devosia sp. TaxID=1871048 RepID=UPI00262A5625|nr:GFA family protein [Devosia sp.]MDB5587070.1 glutathione-dependent formaldehyde-activating [Devosia sp.]
MAVNVIRTGGCLCGAVRYQVQGEPYISGLCHCATCRKLTGSPFSATANWHLSQFQMTGEIQTYERRSFCPTCGSRLFFLFEGGVELFLGTLDAAPNGIEPAVEVWTIRREHWLPVVPGAISYPENPSEL